jgi:hypothetical protein
MSIGWPIISGARNFIIKVKTTVPVKPPMIARGKALEKALTKGMVESLGVGIPPAIATVKCANPMVRNWGPYP